MKNVNALAIVGAAVIISLGLYFGLRSGPARSGPDDPTLMDFASPGQTLEVTVNKMEIHLDDAAQVVRSMEEAFTRSAFADIASHAAELVELAQTIRSETATLARQDSRVIRLLVDRVQHAAHELESAAKGGQHDEAHHAFETLNYELESLRREVQALL